MEILGGVQTSAEPAKLLVGTVKAFANIRTMVILDKEDIPREVDWDKAITLYIIADFKYAAGNSDYSAIKKPWIERYKYYMEL